MELSKVALETAGDYHIRQARSRIYGATLFLLLPFQVPTIGRQRAGTAE
jgi:hypothetical protein